VRDSTHDVLEPRGTGPIAASHPFFGVPRYGSGLPAPMRRGLNTAIGLMATGPLTAAEPWPRQNRSPA
jgi:hypothetical protein